MKHEYKEKVLSHLEGIEKRIKIMNEMLEGNQPSDKQRAITLTREMIRLTELSKDIIDIS